MKTFEELNLIEPLHRALIDENYDTPTPIQAKTIPAALDGRDVLGCAQTGTGKTAAFALPILDRLGERNRKALPNQPMVLVLAPTRELAIQIGDSFATYGRHLRLRTVLVYGGVGQSSQVKALGRGAHVLVATPGRLLDLMNQGYIKLDKLDVFVLDEADRMLDMGFLPDLKRIIKKLPSQRQSLFFSATMPPKITQLSQQLLSNPVSVNVTPPRSTSVKKIKQRVMFVERAGKQALLAKIMASPQCESAIVFTRTKRGANMVADKLVKGGFSALAIHGNKSQNARQRALDSFRKQQVQILVATDVAARGIDIDGITHVVNYDMPVEAESYVHRIGRTGRAGAKGIAISFCTSAERAELRAIQQLIGEKIPTSGNQPGAEAPQSSSGGSSQPSRSRPRRTRSTGNRAGKAAGTRRSTSKPKRISATGKPSRTSGNSDGDSGSVENGPARKKRTVRKGRNARMRAKQTS